MQTRAAPLASSSPCLSCKTRLGLSLVVNKDAAERAGSPMEMVCAAHRSQSSVITSAGQPAT